ncbi:MAG: hypothetical protein COY81_04080 [Candidatus Pacebacteria bacterium CG_4_10_14_0_8_um_filter_43_12]|nr:MAG: hypothetical protein COY81_04080 [Candidatus Pacebacteria bacterium CG_4_10_14_0_8_um_filter_43_12]
MAFLLTSQTNQRTNKGFTLIELIVVIAIIAVLAVLGFGAYMLGIQRAKIARAQGDLDKIKKAILQLELDTNLHPGHTITSTCIRNDEYSLDDSGTTGLVTSDPAFNTAGWKGPYIDEVPKDPWGNAYSFDPDYTCKIKAKGCETYPDDQEVRAILSGGPNGNTGYDEDNIVAVLCKEP